MNKQIKDDWIKSMTPEQKKAFDEIDKTGYFDALIESYMDRQAFGTGVMQMDPKGSWKSICPYPYE